MRRSRLFFAALATPLLVLAAVIPASPARTATAHVVINEVLYWPDGAHPEWVELYNKGPGAADVDGWLVANGEGKAIQLPAYTVPPHSYLIVSPGKGHNDSNFSDHRGAYYRGLEVDFLDNAADSVALVTSPSATRFVDFVAYSATGKRPGGFVYRSAVAHHAWPAASFFESVETDPVFFLTTEVTRGDTIGRDGRSSDTNRPDDWGALGGTDSLGPTQGRRNRQVLDDLVSQASTTSIPLQNPQKPWTVMMLVDGRAVGRHGQAVEQAAEAEIKSVTDHLGSNNNVNFVVQLARKLKQGTTPVFQREAVLPKKLDPSDIPAGESTNPGKPKTTQDFINWATTHYPAQHYIFVYFGHGQGWKRVMAGEDDSLTMSGLSEGLSALGRKFDVVFFHSCEMAMLEVGYQIQPEADYMVASEEVMYSQVFPWAKFLNSLEAAPNTAPDDVSDSIAKLFASGAKDDDQPNQVRRERTIASVDLTALRQNLNPAVDAFAQGLLQDMENRQKLDVFRDNLQIRLRNDAQRKALSVSDANFKDLYHVAKLVDGIPPVQAATHTAARNIVTEMDRRGDGATIRYFNAGADRENAHGLSIYWPHEHDTEGTKAYGDAYDWPISNFPLPTPLQYARDANIRVPVLAVPHQLPDDAPVPNGKPGFRFPPANHWDEFLIRYYKPVAAACIKTKDDCVQTITVPGGTTVTITGIGSSDSDGKDKDDQPAHKGGVLHWYWDKDASVDDVPGGVPAYAPGILYKTCDADDCDRNNNDGTDDERDDKGIETKFTCNTPGTYVITLWTWDEHHDVVENFKLPGGQARTIDHRLHFQVDSATVTVTCEGKGTDKGDSALPGDDMNYLIAFDANDQLEGPAAADMRDTLPAQVELAGEVTCTIGTCSYDPETRTVSWFGTFEPGSVVVIEIPVRIPPQVPCQTEIVNHAQADDGLALLDFTETTLIDC